MSSLYLISIGIILGILELMIGNFFIIFFAISFFIVALINYIFPLNLEFQIVLITLISVISLLLFRKFFKHKNIESNDDFLCEGGRGIVKNGMVYYKGTYWIFDEISSLKEGDIVEIEGIINNQIKIKKSGADLQH